MTWAGESWGYGGAGTGEQHWARPAAETRLQYPNGPDEGWIMPVMFWRARKKPADDGFGAFVADAMDHFLEKHRERKGRIMAETELKVGQVWVAANISKPYGGRCPQDNVYRHQNGDVFLRQHYGRDLADVAAELRKDATRIACLKLDFTEGGGL